MPANNNLRAMLRLQTRQAHQGLDDRLAQLDLTHPDDLRIFLQINYDGFAPYAVTCPEAAVQAQLLAADLTVLGAPPTAPMRAVPCAPDRLAVRYVVEGSRLGTQVLAARWAKGASAVSKRAHHYFGQPVIRGAWGALCDKLQSIPADCELAEQVCQDAIAIFKHFTACADSALPERTQYA